MPVKNTSYHVNSNGDKFKEDWMSTRWRPGMAYMYMLVCICDFILFPMMWTAIQVKYGGDVHAQWAPMTLQGAAFFHIAMGAILGISAYGRTREKLNGVANIGYMQEEDQSDDQGPLNQQT